MIKSHSNLTIYARIFVVFTLLIAIPCFVLLGYNYLNTLSEREQAIRISLDAQSVASQQETNLQVMNALVKASLNNIFAGQSETDFDEALATYRSNYELATSANMSNIRTILLNDNLNRDVIIISDQQQALNETTNQWQQYKQLQDTIVKQLTPLENNLLQGKTLSLAQLNHAYEQIYPSYYSANAHFTDLRIS